MNFRAFLRGYRALHFGGHSADAPVGNSVQPEIQVIDLVHLNHLRKFRMSGADSGEQIILPVEQFRVSDTGAVISIDGTVENPGFHHIHFSFPRSAHDGVGNVEEHVLKCQGIQVNRLAGLVLIQRSALEQPGGKT